MASSLARSWLSLASASTDALSAVTEGLSHVACFDEAGCRGQGRLWVVDHKDRMATTAVSRGALHLASISSWRSQVLAAEAKNAEGASEATLRIPRPPSLTGRLACVHWVSDRSELVMVLMPVLRSLSN